MELVERPYLQYLYLRKPLNLFLEHQQTLHKPQHHIMGKALVQQGVSITEAVKTQFSSQGERYVRHADTCIGCSGHSWHTVVSAWKSLFSITATPWMWTKVNTGTHGWISKGFVWKRRLKWSPLKKMKEQSFRWVSLSLFLIDIFVINNCDVFSLYLI